MKKPKPNILLIIITIGVMLSVMLISYNIHRDQNAPSPYPPTPDFSQEADKIFVSSISGNANLNTGITIERFLPSYSNDVTINKLTINSISFYVLNHTEEPITFANQGFGVIFYRYDSTHNSWEVISLQGTPYLAPKTIPPKTEKWDYDIQNDWTILANDLQALPYNQLRLYVSGIGEVTNKIYGAYLDATISQ